jgi:dynein heavy chain
MDEFSSRIEYPYDSLFVPTVDSISYTKILHYLMGVKKKVFLTGATGVGKSILIQEYISINQDHYSPIQISFSAQTSSVSVQKSIESKLVKKRGKKIIGINGN